MERDAQGRLLKGHSGLKPKGATGLVTKEVRQALLDFVAGKVADLDNVYQSMSPHNQFKMLHAIMLMVLPKVQSVEDPQAIEVIWTDPEPQRVTFEIVDRNGDVKETGEIEVGENLKK